MSDENKMSISEKISKLGNTKEDHLKLLELMKEFEDERNANTFRTDKSLGDKIMKLGGIEDHHKLMDLIDDRKINHGEVYCITNTVNDKKYYGKANCFIIKHSKLIKHGAERRFKEHKNLANAGKTSISKLYDAMREFGTDKFNVEVIAECHKDELANLEHKYITTNKTRENGYNSSIAKIDFGDNKKRIEKIKSSMGEKWKTDENYRDKTSKANLESIKKRIKGGACKTKNTGLPENIYKRAKGKPGYDIRIIRNGKMIITSIQSKNKTDEEVLQMAIEKRDKIMNGVENEGKIDRHVKQTDHNGNDLPKFINYRKSRGNEGYKIAITLNGKRIERYVTDKNLTMNERLQKAIDKLAELQEEAELNQA
jgi:hypothetical protein